MNSSHALRSILALGCSFVMLAVAACKLKSASQKPALQPLQPENIVLITLDTVRADHLHCYGDAQAKTPNMDSLAARGTLFEKAVAQVPLTAPSHASMFTGENPNVHRVRNNGEFILSPSHRTLASILQRQGWNTAAFVSASVLNKVFGLNQGFSVYDDRIVSPLNGDDISTRTANLTIDNALTWLNTQPEKTPFLLWVHLYDAHQPYHPPPEFQKHFPHDPYDAEIAFEDQQIGRLLKMIDQKPFAGKTLIVLLSDHGQSLGDHGEYEHGIFLYDSTLRIAWIMAGPGIPVGKRIQQQARTIDLEPTILDLLGGHSTSLVQGTSLVPALHDQSIPTTYSYEETLCPKLDMGWAELRGIHTPHWMYVRAPRAELYNLDTDPAELHNVIDQQLKEYRELEQKLKELSRLNSDGKETIAVQRVDAQLLKQLQSLGYVSDGEKKDLIQLSGEGDDPKNHLLTLNVLQRISDTKGISPEEEIRYLQRALQYDPQNPTLLNWLIDAYNKSGHQQKALEVNAEILRHGIASGITYSRLGEMYLHTGNLPQAIDALQHAAQLNPLDMQSESNLATAYLQINHLDKAEQAFRRVLVVQEFAPAYNGLGVIAMRRNNLIDARKNFTRAVQLDPQSTEAQLNLGILCTQTHDFPCARTAFHAFLSQAKPAEYKDMIPRVQFALAHMPSGNEP